MGQLQRALPEYLDALNRIPGFLCTLAVDKRIKTVFGPPVKNSRLDRYAARNENFVLVVLAVHPIQSPTANSVC